jgi:hypothetical protein
VFSDLSAYMSLAGFFARDLDLPSTFLYVKLSIESGLILIHSNHMIVRLSLVKIPSSSDCISSFNYSNCGIFGSGRD